MKKKINDFAENLAFKYHGNYGGPNYTSGKFQNIYSNPDWNVEPTDQLDQLFRKHDWDYGHMDHQKADQLFLQRTHYIEPSYKKQLAYEGFRLKAGGEADGIIQPDYDYPWENSLNPHYIENRFKPSAVTSRDGFKNKFKSMPKGKGKGQKRGGGSRQGPPKGRNRGMPKVFTSRAKKFISGLTPSQVRQRQRSIVMGNRRTMMSGTRVITAPLNRGQSYTGYQMSQKMGILGRHRIKTRWYVGQMMYQTGGNARIQPDGSGWCNSQWYFCPTNAFYMGNTSNFVTMARMYEKYVVNNCAWELDSLLTPGNQVAYQIILGTVSDPNYGATVINSFNPNAAILKASILAVHESRSFPAWQQRITWPVPSKYLHKKLYCRGADFDEAIAVTNTYTATNRQTYAFGFWFAIAGALPAADLAMFDVFCNIDIEFSEYVATQTLDTSNSTSYSQKRTGDVASEIKELKSEVSGLKEIVRGIRNLEFLDEKERPCTPKVHDIDDTYIHLPLSERKEVNEDQPNEVVKKKSSSNKSTKSNDSLKNYKSLPTYYIESKK